MNILHKAIFIIIAFSIFSFLFFVTFIANSFSSFEKPFYEKNEQGLFELIKNGENFSLSKEVSTNSGAILINKFNLSDKVIYSYGEVQTEYLSGALNITIKPGIYYFQLKEINTKYIISGDGFEIENKGPGKFIINNLNSRKNLVFSQDALLSLNLKHYKTNEDITSIALYPHSYLLFNPLKNIFVKNSDLLKISQIFTLGFFNEKINNSEDFLNKILINSSKGKELILNSIDYYNKEKNQKNIYINNYLDSTFGTLPGEVFINKYSKLFINPNKKSLYYKNIIIREIHDLLKSEIIDIKTINNINENLNGLKQIDIDGYESMKEFIKFNYINITIGEFKVNSKINFSKLLNKINNKNELYSIPSLIFLEQIFNNYNPDSIYFYNKINTFIKNNFDDYGISIDTSNNKKSIDEIKEIDYLLYFLENIILNSDLSSDSNTSEIINLFNNYINIANTFYLYSNDSIKRIGLFTNSKVLNKFIKIIETNYFESERKDELIILQEGVDIVKNDILLLEKNINSIFIFFNNNNIVLDLENSTKDKFLKEKLYPNLEKTYKEYFNALIDYDDYLAKYDINKKELLDTKTINENTNKIVLSIESAKEYISQFNGIQFKNTNIKIMDYIYCLNPIEENLNIELINPYCYKIENLNIDKLPTSFILYPFLNNKIDNIKVGNSLKSGSYKLDEVEIELEKKIKMAKDNKEQFEFENFLVNTFGRQVISNNNIATNTIDDEVFEQEDSVIRIFKRNKLLGELGDFAKLGGFLDIEYNNLKVEKSIDVLGGYNIYLSETTFFLSIAKGIDYYGVFSSDYDFSKKHSFINPKLNILEKKSRKDLLLGNPIYIEGEYGVNQINEEIKSLFLQYKSLKFSIETIYEVLSQNKIKIIYNKETNSFNIESIYKGEKLIIILSNGNVLDTLYKGEKLIDGIINYESLNTILNKIK